MEGTVGSADLYWIPLGAGAHIVRISGRAYERLEALAQRRPARDLYHSALLVDLPEGRYVIEQAPVPDGDPSLRGVVAGGAVGTRAAGRFRIFRYEVRCWRDGTVPDLGRAVASPVRVVDDPVGARRVVDLVPAVPTPVWGRDELRAGEMWNSNSVISWVLTRSGIALGDIRPPERGRAPGWDAGCAVAARAGHPDRGAGRPRPAGAPLIS